MKRIKLTQGKYTLIDDEDLALVSQHHWCVQRTVKNRFYAVTAVQKDYKRQKIHMHRLILKARKGQDVDHKDQDGLNNQKSNIRLCTRQQNMTNKPPRNGFKGVNDRSTYRGYEGNKKCYMAAISVKGKRIYLGHFFTKREAAKAYDKAALKWFGEFANLNFP